MARIPMDQVLTVILGGGRGTRLFPLTKMRSKPAVPLGGKYRLIDIPISNCINSGIRRILVLSQFNMASLTKHIYEAYRFDAYSKGFIEILAAEQTPENLDWFQGTADAVRKQLKHMKTRSGNYILILSGDHLYKMNYREFLQTHIENGAELTIGVQPVMEEQIKEFGIMKVDDKGKVTGFMEKPKDQSVYEPFRVAKEIFQGKFGTYEGKDFLASMGIYIFNRDLLFDILDNTDLIDFGKDIIPKCIKDNKEVYGHFFNGYWEDIGTIKAFFDANIALTDEKAKFKFYDVQFPVYTNSRYLPASKIHDCVIKNSIISDGCIIFKATIERSVIGIRSFIEADCEIKNAIIMGADYYEFGPRDGAQLLGIGKNSVIHNCIIDKNVCIGNNVKLVNKDNVFEGDRENFYIRDGIIVVPKLAIIPHNTVI
jgi:glucose-1-phosphate adenylyltransferase